LNPDWAKGRERALERLFDHASRGLLDSDIQDFLLEFNRTMKCAYTTSSCSGRVAILRGPSIFDKRRAEIVVAYHDPRACKENLCQKLAEASRQAGGQTVWVSLQPPILHLVTLTQEQAEQAARCGDRAGFSRACYRAYRGGGYHVELAVQDKLTLIGAECGSMLEACRVLERYKERLSRLQQCLLQSLEC